MACRWIKRQFPWLHCLFADAGYQGPVAAGNATRVGLKLEIVKRQPYAEGFEVVPRRWVIEKTFGWLSRNRRLAKDFERLIETSTALVVAIIQILVRRLANGRNSMRAFRIDGVIGLSSELGLGWLLLSGCWIVVDAGSPQLRSTFTGVDLRRLVHRRIQKIQSSSRRNTQAPLSPASTRFKNVNLLNASVH